MTDAASGTDPAEPHAITLCLTDIDGFESLNVRMPTPDERRELGIGAAVPVLVIRRRGGKKQLTPADLVTVTIDSGPPPAEREVRDAARYVLGCIVEDLGNVLSDMTQLNAALSGPPSKLAKIAAELQQRRDDEFFCAEPCPFTAGPAIPGQGTAPGPATGAKGSGNQRGKGRAAAAGPQDQAAHDQQDA